MQAQLHLAFLLNQSINLFSLVAIQYLNGLLVTYKDVKVNYTRKINHFLLFFIPIAVNRGYVLEDMTWLYVLGAFLAVGKFVFYVQPLRERCRFIAVMFSSFDRPEDRPHTLIWIVTQTAAGYLVLIPMSIIFAERGIFELILIPIFIYGIGDGLAEPVGVRFGRHAYRVYALFSKRTYVRTLEGSAVVFLTSLIVVILFQSFFTEQQFLAALITVPLFMTLAEAFSPHTWDSPLMFLTGGITLILVQSV